MSSVLLFLNAVHLFSVEGYYHVDDFALPVPIHLLDFFKSQPLKPELVSDITPAFRLVVRVVQR